MPASSVNVDKHAPKARAFDGTDDVDVTLNPSLRGIDVLGAGNLTVEGIDGNQVTYTFNTSDFTGTAETSTVFPYRLELQIRKIISATTTVADADLILLY